MATHNLKINPKFFYDVWVGEKSFEVRFNDRDFQVGDEIIFRTWENGEYTGSVMYCTITYLLEGFKGLKKGYVVLGISNVW